MILRRSQWSFVSFALLIFSFSHLVIAVRLWNSPGSIPTTVPAACRAALTQNITCEGSLITARVIADGGVFADAVAAEYCTSSCRNSIQSLVTNVQSRCGNTTYGLYFNSTFQQAPLDIANGLSWAYRVACLQDSDGFCLDDLYNGTRELCSDCALRYSALMVSHRYGRVRVNPSQFSSLLSSCNVPEQSYTWSYTPPASTTTSRPPATPEPSVCAGDVYTVQAGDTCESISADASIGTDNMITRNGLDYNCTLLQPGLELCLDRECEVHTVEVGETCDDITRDQDFRLVQLTSWNPTIHYDCDNLDGMIGRSICISPPGGGNYSYNPSIDTDLGRPTLTDPMFSTWVDAEIVTNAPNFTTIWDPPLLVPTPTTTSVVYNDSAEQLWEERIVYCWITDEDINNGFVDEQLPEGCASLLDRYCYPPLNSPVPPSPTRIPAACTPDRSNYTTSEPPNTTSTAPGGTPTPIQPGMIDGCRQFYFVQSGDTCTTIAARFGIVLDAFYAYNTGVGSDCRSLYLDTYVCVGID